MDSKLAVFFNNKKNHHMRQILPPNPENKTWKKREKITVQALLMNMTLLIINTTQSILIKKQNITVKKSIQFDVVNRALEMCKVHLVRVNDGTRKQKENRMMTL